MLGLIWRHGLFPTLVAGAFIYLLYSLATNFSRQLEAIELRFDAHQAAMDRGAATAAKVDAETVAAIQQQSNRLRGICYGVTDDGSRARALCDQ